MEQRKKRILIVEDEKNIADILDYNVQKQGYDTAVAYDGEKGLALALCGRLRPYSFGRHAAENGRL